MKSNNPFPKFFGFLLIYYFLMPVFTIAGNDGIKTFAIVIGLSEYHEVPGLDFAHRDAKAFAAFLKSKAGGEVDSANIRLFINEDATAINIGAALEEINLKLSEGDKFVFFFAGHGDIEASNMDNGLLLLYNAPATSYWSFGDDYIKVSDLKSICQNLASRKIEMFIFTDACRSGSLSGGAAGIYSTSLALRESWANEIKVLSCKPDEVSLEGLQWGGGHGLFTYYLIDGLYGLADNNKNKQVTLSELESYLENEVSRESSPTIQTPFAVGNTLRVLSSVDKNELADLKAKKDKEIPLMNLINTKGLLDQLLHSEDSIVLALYRNFDQAIEDRSLVVPEGLSAYDYYLQISDATDNEQLVQLMQRNLAAELQSSAMEMILPILKLESFEKKSIADYELTAKELETAIELLGETHFLANALKVRKLFIESYALCESYELEFANKSEVDTMNLFFAIQKLDDAVIIDSLAAYPWFQLGWIYNTKGDFLSAQYVLEKYVDRVPKNKRALNNLGVTCNDIGDFDGAIENFEKAIILDSNYAIPYNNFGLSYAFQGKLEASIPWFEKAIAKDPDFIEATNNLGLVYIYLGDYDLAKDIFQKILTIDPEYFDAYYNLAAIYSRENNKSKAIENLEKALELGLDDRKRIESDSDFEFIRGSNAYNKLMEMYFGK